MAARNASAPRVNFTKGRIERFSCPPGRAEAFLWDTAVPGLGLRARASGSRVFIFQARLYGRTIRKAIGSPDAWDLEQARKEANRLRVLLDRGIHPTDEERERRDAAEAVRQEEERASVTFADVWDAYVAARRGDWSERHLRDHGKAMQEPGRSRKRSKRLTVAGPLYPLRSERLAELTAERVGRWVEHEAKRRPTVTAHAYRLFRACLSWAEEQPQYRGIFDSTTVLTKTVRRAVPKPKARTDVLQREQLRPWFSAVRALGNPVISAYLQALLLTGARREELARLRWSEVDFIWRSLIFRDKVEGEREVPLTPYLAVLLHALPRRNRWVFSSPSAKSGHLSDANQAHSRALRSVGLPHVTLHGLRRSFGTLSEWCEVPVGVVAQIQGHKPSALAEKHYRRRPLDLLRRWHVEIERWILDEAGIPQSAKSDRALQLVQ